MAEGANTGAEARYKIGDVCRIADVQPYVLRYWESEFPVLAPDKSIPGPRTYSSRELKLIEQIKRLLYDEGYTIAGAKKRLESEGSGRSEAKESAADTSPIAEPPKPSKAEKPEKLDKPRPPLRTKAPTPTFTDVSSVEPQAPEVTQPVGSEAAKSPADDRVARAVADLKEILALLSRAEP
jgi:DNA-binding transcriptional MerR regulator